MPARMEIRPGPEARLSRGQKEEFLQETFSFLNSDNLARLVSLLSSYVEKEADEPAPHFAAHQDFARLTNIVFQPILRREEKTVRVAQEQIDNRGRIGACLNFWMKVGMFLSPDGEFSLAKELTGGPSFQKAQNQAELALIRADAAIRMAATIAEGEPTFRGLGFSSLALKAWVMVLIGSEDKVPFWEKNDRREMDQFRAFIPSCSSVTTLAPLRERLLVNLLLQSRRKPLGMLEDLAKVVSSNNQLRGGPFISALRWWGAKPPKEKERAVTLLLASAGHFDLKEVELPGDCLSPKNRAQHLHALLRILARLYEGNGDLVRVLDKPVTEPGKARALVNQAEGNFKRHRALFNETVAKRFTNIVGASVFQNFSLSEGQLLLVILVMNREPFNPYEFKRNLEDLSRLEEFSLMLKSEDDGF